MIWCYIAAPLWDSYKDELDWVSGTDTDEPNLTSAPFVKVWWPHDGKITWQRFSGLNSVIAPDWKAGDPPKWTYFRDKVISIIPDWFANPRPKQYGVTFQDFDLSVLKTEIVNEGHSATPPEPPVRKYYNFTGWSADYAAVFSNLTCIAQYEKTNVRQYDNPRVVSVINRDTTLFTYS